MPFILLELMNTQKYPKALFLSDTDKTIRTSVSLHSSCAESIMEMESERTKEPEVGEECCKTLPSGHDVAIVLMASQSSGYPHKPWVWALYVS